MNAIKACVCTFFGIFGTWVTMLFGGWTEDMVTLITVMSIDFIMGLAIAIFFSKSPKSDSGAVSSKSCFRGLCKKCTMLLFVLIARRLDITLETDYIKTTTVISFIANEMISVIENAGIMGIPLPGVIKKVIDVLKDKENNKSKI